MKGIGTGVVRPEAWPVVYLNGSEDLEHVRLLHIIDPNKLKHHPNLRTASTCATCGTACASSGRYLKRHIVLRSDRFAYFAKDKRAEEEYSEGQDESQSREFRFGATRANYLSFDQPDIAYPTK